MHGQPCVLLHWADALSVRSDNNIYRLLKSGNALAQVTMNQSTPDNNYEQRYSV